MCLQPWVHTHTHTHTPFGLYWCKDFLLMQGKNSPKIWNWASRGGVCCLALFENRNLWPSSPVLQLMSSALAFTGNTILAVWWREWAKGVPKGQPLVDRLLFQPGANLLCKLELQVYRTNKTGIHKQQNAQNWEKQKQHFVLFWVNDVLPYTEWRPLIIPLLSPFNLLCILIPQMYNNNAASHNPFQQLFKLHVRHFSTFLC